MLLTAESSRPFACSSSRDFCAILVSRSASDDSESMSRRTCRASRRTSQIEQHTASSVPIPIRIARRSQVASAASSAMATSTTSG